MNESFAATNRASIADAQTPGCRRGVSPSLSPAARQDDGRLPVEPFQEVLVSALADGLGFLETNACEFASHVELSEAYGVAYAELRQRRSSLEAWVANTLRLNLVVSPSAVREQEAWRAELLKLEEGLVDECRLPPMPLSRNLRAELAAEPLAKAHGLLMAELRGLVRQTAGQVETLCETLLGGQRLGQVEWVTDNACKFTWWSCELADVGKQSQDATRVEVKDDLETVEVTRHTRGHSTVRRGRHEQHLLGAESLSVAEGEERSVQVPVALTAALAEAPAWLRSVIRLVAGQRVRQLDIVRETTDRWESSEVVSRQTRSVVHRDPAIAIGPYCLTGWAEEDEQAETERRLVLPWLIGATAALAATPTVVALLSGAVGVVSAPAFAWWALGAALVTMLVRSALSAHRTWKPKLVLPTLAFAGSASLFAQALFVTLARPSVLSVSLVVAGLVALPPCWRFLRGRVLANLRGVRWLKAGRGHSYRFAVIWELF